MRYGPRFRQHRKLLNTAMSQRVTRDNYKDIQEEETKSFLRHLLARPEDYWLEIRT
jgi:cytochrome P450